MDSLRIEGDVTRVADGVTLAYRATSFAGTTPMVEGGELIETSRDGTFSTGVRVVPDKDGEWRFLNTPPGFDKTPLDRVGVTTIAEEVFRRWLQLRASVGAAYGRALDPKALAAWLNREKTAE